MSQASRWRRAIWVGLAVSASMGTFALSGSVQAQGVQQVQPNIKWGGRTVSVDVDPNNSSRACAATDYGGVFCTTDAGATWVHSDTLIPAQVMDISISANNGNILIVTAIEDSRNTLTPGGPVGNGGGIWRSTDFGATWQRPDNAVPTDISGMPRPVHSAYEIATEASTSNVYVGTDFGLAVSTDDGASWSHVSVATTDVVVSSVIAANGIIDALSSVGTHYRSDPTVSGGAWVANALPSNPRVTFGRYEIHALARSPLEANVLFAAVLDATGYQMLESVDSGQTWSDLQVPPTPRLNRVGFAVVSPAYNSGSNFDLWYSDGVDMYSQQCSAAGAGGASCGTGAAAWQFINLRPTDPDADPENPGPVPHNDPSDIVFAKDSVPLCADGGVQDGRVIPAFVATDGGVGTSPCGANWGIVGGGNAGFNALQLYQITGQAHGDGSPTFLYFGTQDNDIWASTDGGSTWPRQIPFEGFTVQIPSFSVTPSAPTVTGVRCGPCRNYQADPSFTAWADSWIDPPGTPASSATSAQQACPDTDLDGLCDAAVGCTVMGSGLNVCQAGCTDGGSGAFPAADGFCDGVPCVSAGGGAQLNCAAGTGGNPQSQVLAPHVLDDGTFVQFSDQSTLSLATNGPQWTLYSSTDNGTTWTPVPGSEVLTNTPGSQPIVEGPANNATMYLGGPGDSAIQISGLPTTGLPASAAVTFLPNPAGLGITDYTPLFLGGTLAFGVDPKNPDDVLFGAFTDGTMRSYNSASNSWVNTAPMQQLQTLVTANGTYNFDTTSLVNGSSTDQSQVTTIAFDPNGNTVVVGTIDSGIISSLDNGATWARVCGSEQIPKITSFFFDEGCTDPSCPIIRPENLYAASYGRGLWTVEAADQQIPAFVSTAPDELVFDCGPVQLEEPTAVDTCSNLDISISAIGDRAGFSENPSCELEANRTFGPCGYFQRGTTNITWTAQDAAGSSTTDTSTVTVDDQTPPVFDPVEDVVSYLTCASEETFVLDVPTATDSCDVTVVVTGEVISSDSVGVPLAVGLDGTVTLPVGTHVVRWVASDGINLSDPLDQTIVVYPGLFADNNFLVEDRARTLTVTSDFAAIANGGDGLTRIGVEAFSGSVLSVASVELRDHSTVDGFVDSSGSVQVFNEVTVGTITEFTSVPLPPFPDLEMISFSGGDNITVNSGETEPLSPGSYGSIFLNSGGTLELSSGVYILDQFFVNSASAAVVIDDSAGPVYLYVGQQVAYRDVFVTPGGVSAEIFLGYAGTSQLTVDAPFLGAILAPNAILALGNGNAQVFRGSFAALDIVLRPGADMVCAPTEITFLGEQAGEGATCSNGVEDGTETDVDCGGPACSGCGIGEQCDDSADCESDNCSAGLCTEDMSPSCSEVTAIDLGAPGNNVYLDADACIKIDDAYPSWWDVRNVNLQSTTGSGYPIGFTWSNDCAGSSGSGVFNWDWQSQVFGPTDEACPTLIQLTGTSGGVTLRYWAN